MSRSCMWRRSCLRWTVIPFAPACSQMTAAVTMLGSIVFRASRIVATWSMLTFSFAVMIVDTVLRIRANLGDFFEHTHAVAKHAYLASLIIVPPYRNFL